MTETTALVKMDEIKEMTGKASIEAERFVAMAQSFAVQSFAQYNDAAALQNQWKAAVKALKAEHDRRKKPVLEIGRTIDSDFGRPIKMFEKAIEAISLAMRAYDAKVEAERQRRQVAWLSAADKERQAREAKAEEARRKAEEARRLAKEADTERERARLLAQADRDEARAKLHEGKAETLFAPIVPEAPTPEGISKVKMRTFDESQINIRELAQAAVGGTNVMVLTRKKYQTQMPTGLHYPLADEGKVLIVQSIAPRPELLNCLKADTTQLRKLIAAVGETMTIPGVPIREEIRYRTKGGNNVQL